MIFNSFEFLVFLLVVFCLYWFVFNKSVKHQNLLLLFSSYVFYGWWDYRFLSLIFLSTIVDYTIGLNIHKQKSVNRKKLFLWTSILFNLTLLGFFKYYNFFIDSWINLVQSFGYDWKFRCLYYYCSKWNVKTITYCHQTIYLHKLGHLQLVLFLVTMYCCTCVWRHDQILFSSCYSTV